MSILDDAIREHLELKRAHGADEGQLKKLEDEAFGPPQRPDEIDPFNEAPTEFLLSPTAEAADGPEIADQASRGGRRPNITDLQEAPPEPPTGEEEAASPTEEAARADEELAPVPDAPPPSPAAAAEVPLPPPADEDAPAAEGPPPAEEAPAPPADEEHPAGEHEIVADSGPGTDERHVIADQPTQMFDVQAEMDAEVVAPAEQESPSDDELVDAVQSEPPSSAPPAPEEAIAAPTEIHEQPPLDTRGPDAEVAGHPPATGEPEQESAEFDFLNEQRLADELDQALEAPLPPTDEHIALPQYEDAGAQGGIFDFEGEQKSYDEGPSEEVLRRHDAPAEEAPRQSFDPPSEELEPPSEEYEAPSEETPSGSAAPAPVEGDIDYDPDTGHEDVLEDTPRFLEDAPEDDDLWFEQKPPKDFDLD